MTGSGADEPLPKPAGDKPAINKPLGTPVIADLALRGVTALGRRMLVKRLTGMNIPAAQVKDIVNGRGLGQAAVKIALTRIGFTSVPGAVVAGGFVLARHYLKRRAKAKAAIKETGTAPAPRT